MRRHHRTFLAFLAGILFLSAGSAWAQFTQYTLPGGPEDRPESRKDRLEREVEEARYHLGPLRVMPWLNLRDAAYVRSFLSEAGETPSGFTATVGAGAQAYLRTGPKVIWTAQILPQYVWWSNNSDRNRVNGRYGLGVHAFFNRLTVEATAMRQQEQEILTPELPEPVSSRVESGELTAELRMTGALSVFAGSRTSRVRNLEDELELLPPGSLELLDREELVTRAGIRWRPRERLLIGLGAETSRVDFERDLLDRSNEGTAPVLEVTLNRPKLFIQTDLAARSLKARRGSAFKSFEEVTGSASVSLRPQRRTDYWVYGSRNLVYSLDPTAAYLIDERAGASVSLQLGGRTSTRVFAETGKNDYVFLSGAVPRRRDDLFSWGGAMIFRIRGPLVLEIRAARTDLDSSDPGSDRSYTVLGTRLNLLGFRSR